MFKMLEHDKYTKRVSKAGAFGMRRTSEGRSGWRMWQRCVVAEAGRAPGLGFTGGPPKGEVCLGFCKAWWFCTALHKVLTNKTFDTHHHNLVTGGVGRCRLGLVGFLGCFAPHVGCRAA